MGGLLVFEGRGRPTAYGPLSSVALDGFGLLFYNAHYYSPVLGRFVSADTVVPAGVQGLDRYAYAENNPLRYTDPSGHCVVGGHEMPDDTPACRWNDRYKGKEKEPHLEDWVDPSPLDDDDDIDISFDTDEIVENIPGTGEQWAAEALILDEIALAYDTLLGIYVLAWIGAGLAGGLTFEGIPVAGAAGGAAGYIIGEGSIAGSNALVLGNLVASAATAAGLIGDMKNGNTSVESSLSISSESISLNLDSQVSSSALRSVVITAAGWGANLVTLSLPLQIAAVENDRGWCSTTSIRVNVRISLQVLRQ